MYWRVSIHFGNRTDEEIKKIARAVAESTGMDVYIVKDYIEKRIGTAIPPNRPVNRNSWARYITGG